jgi:5-methylcytosine-specific restriction endonuclease McrA
LSRGGGNGPENLVISCATCNVRKNDRLPHEMAWRLC